jgi:hypothetical protein
MSPERTGSMTIIGLQRILAHVNGSSSDGIGMLGARHARRECTDVDEPTWAGHHR